MVRAAISLPPTHLHRAVEIRFFDRPSMLGSEVYKSFSQVLACWSLGIPSFCGWPHFREEES